MTQTGERLFRLMLDTASGAKSKSEIHGYGQSEFVPISQLPPADQLPAAPLLVGAYAFIWLAVMFYLWSIWRRLNKVETEMHALARKTERR